MTEPSPTRRRWPTVLAVALAVLLLLIAGAVILLDRILTSAARDQAQRLAADWQRPVEIGAVSTAFLGGLGVRVEGVRIGAAAGEPRPLLELERAEVKLELLRALRSAGRELHVRSAELKGLRVTMIRLKDGTTNTQRLAGALAKGEPARAPAAAAPPPAEAAPADRSGIRIEHAAVRGARIAFVDETAGGRELFVDQIDLTVDGLAAGAPLDVTLQAGLLSARQNLEVKLHAPPLPASLIPAPDRLTLKVAPVDLTPLAAFTPREAGFRGGRFTADLEVGLGAAVPGGAGPSVVRGGFAATGLRFDGQEGGRALDVTLDADLTADTARGDLTVRRLLLTFGPAALEGKGKVTGLLSEHPAVEGLRVVSRGLDPAALAPFYPPLPRLLGGTVAGPVALSVEAAGTAERPVVELRADLTPVRLDFARQLEKAAGARLLLTARLRGGGGGALRFEADGDLAGVDLRPGGTLAKKPGDRLSLAVAGSRRATGEAQSLELESLTVGLLDTTLKAKGKVELAPGSRRFDLAATVDRVDADRLLLPAPPGPATASGQDAGKGGGAAKAGPSPYAGLSGRCSLRVGEATARKQKVTDLRTTLVVKEDEVTFEEGRLGIWGGTLSIAGTQARLAPPERPFKVSARAQGVQAGSVLATWSDKTVLTGQLDAEVQLAGKGESAEAIKRALDGTVEGKLADGVFHGKDLIAEVTGPLAKAVPALKQRAGGGTTSLGKLVPFSLRIQGGKALLQKPVEVEQRDATLSARGSVSLDGGLDLPITLNLAPSTVAELSGGRARLQEPLPFQFTLAGKAWGPHLAGLDVKPAAKTLLQTLGTQALGKALGLGGAPAAGEATGAQPATPAEKAGDAKKKLEDDAKKALKKLLGR